MFQAGPSSGQGSSSPQSTLAFWQQRVRDWYPGWRQRAYFLPPVLMNRTQHQAEQVAGLPVHVPQPPVSDLPRGHPPALQESAVRDDRCQRRVIDCLYQLSEAQGEVMFVISQLNFAEYLDAPCYAAAASQLPGRPIDLKPLNKHRGDFDVLVIHRKYGILVGEIKAVGDLPPSSSQEQDQLVKKKVEQAIKQLDKADDVLGHLVSDLQPAKPRILKTLMLPNLSTADLQRVLADNQQLCQVINSWTVNTGV